MKRGPKQKAGELAEAQGNPGRREIVKTPDAVDAIASTAPDFLKNDAARRIWAILSPQLAALRFVKRTDDIVVGRYCLHLARFISLNEKLAASGDTVTYTTSTNHGTMERLHPNFAAMMRIEEALVKIEDRIGLSPASRQSLLARVAPGAGDGSGIQSGLTDPRTTPQPSHYPLGLFQAPPRAN